MLKMPYSDEALGEFPDAVWKVVDVHATTEGVMIKAYVYRNAEQVALKRPLGEVKSVHLSEEEIYGNAQFGGLVALVEGAAETLLRTHPSMLVGDAPKQVVDKDGKPVFEEDGTTPVMEKDMRVQFFAGATDV